MSFVTKNLQVTVPQEIAEKYRIEPGDEVAWAEAGSEIRVIPAKALPRMLTTQERLRLFDEATERQHARQTASNTNIASGTDARGWTREELYDRDRAR